MKCFVITLPEAKERQDHIRKGLGDIGLDFEFFDAVDGRQMDVATHPAHHTLKRRLYFGRDLKGGEMGVLLSHRAIYQKMVDESIAHALILEDDVVLSADAPAVIQALEKEEQDYDLVRFLGKKKIERLLQHTKRNITSIYKLNRLRTAPGGAYAYVLTLSGAQKMLRAMDRNYVPIDTLMGHVWRTGLEAFVVRPRIAYVDLEQPQYIGAARFNKTERQLNLWQKIIFPFTRAWFKLSEAFLKRIYYWKNKLKDQ